METETLVEQKNRYRKIGVIGLCLLAALVLAGLLLASVSLQWVEPAQAKSHNEPAAATIILDKSHTGDFITGLSGSYNISVDISGGPISGTETNPYYLVVTDTLPSQFTSFTYSAPGWGVKTSGNIITGVYTITSVITNGLDLSPIIINVAVPEITPMVVTNTATALISLSYTNTIPTEVAPVSDSDRTNIVNQVDLGVSKSFEPAIPLDGGFITYTVVVNNYGPITATGVKITDTLPSHLTYLSHNVSTGQTYNPSTGLWTIGTLAKGASATLKLYARIVLLSDGDTIVNNASGLVSDLIDYNPSNNSASTSFPVGAAADLQIYKTDNQTTVSPGDEFAYTVFITNAGSADAAAGSIVITDILPTYISYVTDTLQSLGITYTLPSARTYRWEYPYKIEAGDTITFELGVKAASSMAGTTQINTVMVSTESTEGNKSNNTATDTDTIVYSPSVSFSKSVTPSEQSINSNFTFYIYVNNNSSVSISNVVVKDTFSSYLQITSVSTTRGSASYSSSTRLATINIGTLSAGSSATITVICKVSSAATSTTYLTNYAYLTYSYGGSSFPKTASVSYRISSSSTLPGTGGMEPGVIALPSVMSAGVWLAIICSILLFTGGIVLLVLWHRFKTQQSDWAGWCLRMGSILMIAAVGFGAAAWGLSLVSSTPSPQLPEQIAETTPVISSIKPVFIPPADDELEFLPDYPVPTPSFKPTLQSTEQVIDDTAPQRIMIPDLGLDTVIKYIPYDGLTWLISGLKQEVAWLGNTSWPGLGGNTGLAGHVTLSNGENGPFRFLDQLTPGSPITIFTEKNIYTYKVRQSQIVDASQISVLAPTSQPSLTLITCTHWDSTVGTYLYRYILYADLDSSVPIGVDVSGN